MATALFKFRCVQCQKLLGAPASKAGATVKCPRCATELIVPEPDLSPEVEEDGPAIPDLSSIGLSSIEPLARLRPEDLRALPGFVVDPEVVAARTAPSENAWTPEIAAKREPSIPPLRETARPAESRRDDLAPAAIGAIFEAVARSSPSPEADDAPEPEADPVARAVEVEPQAIRPRAMARRQDVAIPRAALIGWSFAMVLGIAGAFFAGLLAGHFVWK